MGCKIKLPGHTDIPRPIQSEAIALIPNISAGSTNPEKIPLAIIFGNQARKADPKDSKAKAGVILGWVTLGLIVLAIAVLIVVLASWTYGGWG